jgi:predicted solute-binding protein
VNRVRLGAVGYLNARPLVYGLESSDRFGLRFDIPSECARLLHARPIDVGLIPSIEYLRGPAPYKIVPGPAVVSHGPVASVAIYTRREPRDIRTMAMDASSRTSVALATIVANRAWHISPAPIPLPPDLPSMLSRADAALIIGDNALFLDAAVQRAQKIDLGEAWTRATGLPFVYAFWAGWPDALTPEDVAALQQARDAGATHVDEIARTFFPDDQGRQAIVGRYLRDNIQYVLGGAEEEGLRTFYRYASELNLVSPFDGELRFFDVNYPGVR